MAFKVGTGVVSPAFGTGTVMESNDDKTKVRFDKDDAVKTILNQYLQPSQHKLKVVVKPMETIVVNLDDLFQLDRLPLKRRADCWISFSVNGMNDVWNFITRGWTKEEKRNYIQGRCRVIDRVVELYLLERLGGGRVLLTSEGAKFRTNARNATLSQRKDVPFARFKLPENWVTAGPVNFRPPQRAIYAPSKASLAPYDPSPASD